MIEWWIFPLLCTIAAVFLVAIWSSDCNVPYRGVILAAGVFVLTPILALMWLFCFLISLICA